jgi:hypothetical protein
MYNDNRINQLIADMVSEDNTLTPGEQRANLLKGDCSGWCWPLYLYIALSILQLLTIPMMKVYDPTTKTYTSAPVAVKVRYMLLSAVWNLFVGFLMYYLCSKCHSGWAWFILLLPIIFNVILVIMILVAVLAVNNA